MNKEKKYYGIYFNDTIPKLDKKNYFTKEVTIKFEGEAYLIGKKRNQKVEKTEIENEHKLKKEGDYEIEFINMKNEIYHLEISIKSSFWLFLFLLFIFGSIIAFLLCNPCFPESSPLSQLFDSINLSILPLNIGKNVENNYSLEKNEKEEIKKYVEMNKKSIEKNHFENEYYFDVSLKKESSHEINLFETMCVEDLEKHKIAPSDRGSFAIVMSTQKSNINMEYEIKFQDITHEKPTHLSFQIRGKNQNYSTLQELATTLKGNMNKQSKKKIIIDWQWPYETGENEKSILENDKIDTTESQKLNCYQFKVIVTGKENL